MYRNLEAEIIRININKKEIANAIGKSYNTLLSKLRGEYPFTFDEAEIIHQKFFPEFDFKQLFAKDEHQSSA